LQIWKQHAKHYALKHKDSEFNNIILYNNWVSDKAYRDEIGVNIGAPNIVDAIDYVSPIGNGSSFIKVQKEQDVEKYTTRYNQFKLPDEIIELILDDQEVLDLNQQIFNININDSL
jgi:hypothetical protein